MNILARLQFNHARCLFFPSLFRRIPIWPSFKQVFNIEAQASTVNDYSKNLPCRTSDSLSSASKSFSDLPVLIPALVKV